MISNLKWKEEKEEGERRRERGGELEHPYHSVEVVCWVVVVKDGWALPSNLSMKAGFLGESCVLRAEVIQIVLLRGKERGRGEEKRGHQFN